MNRILTLVSQPDSARRVLSGAGIQHEDHSQGELTVGVTAGATGVPQRVHFCSSRIHDVRCEVRGDGQPMPMMNYQVVLEGGLPPVPRDGLLRFRANIHPNGKLTIAQRNDRAWFVPVPDSMADQGPFAYDGGAEDMAAAYGCSSVQQMFELHGEEILVG
jgi:hypothetical protein